MPRRRAPLSEQPEIGPSTAQQPEVSHDECHESAACTHEPDEQQLLEMLADYFSILRQWSLNGRSDDNLAPDSTTEQQ